VPSKRSSVMARAQDRVHRRSYAVTAGAKEDGKQTQDGRGVFLDCDGRLEAAIGPFRMIEAIYRGTFAEGRERNRLEGCRVGQGGCRFKRRSAAAAA
jgi:hypothetical protein